MGSQGVQNAHPCFFGVYFNQWLGTFWSSQNCSAEDIQGVCLDRAMAQSSVDGLDGTHTFSIAVQKQLSQVSTENFGQ